MAQSTIGRESITPKTLENEEEWNSFMARVDHVGKVIRGLASKDVLENEIALEKAEQILGRPDIVNEGEVYVKNSRTIINRSALNDNPSDQHNMSQEAFMRSVEIDVKKRTEERKLNKEAADRYLKYGNEAFRKQDYTKAASDYTKAIEKISDSCLLYTNRALTYIKLGLNQRALEDSRKALRVNEKSLKGLLYQAQALYNLGEYEESNNAIKEACQNHPNKKDLIEGMQKEWTKKHQDN